MNKTRRKIQPKLPTKFRKPVTGSSLIFAALLVVAGFQSLDAQDKTAKAHAPTRPNVLFIAVDDLNDWCGVMGGHPQAHTPNLDRLAARGTFFERAYCAAPSCQPSRVAVMTGLRPSTSGDYVNEQKLRKLLPDVVTMPQYFTAHGYRVAGGGKIFHHSDPDLPSWPEYFRQPKDPVPRPLAPSPISDLWSWQPLDEPDEAMGDCKVVSWATEWLAKNKQEPFFLAVGFYRPHLPLHVPRKYFDMFPLDTIVLPVVKENDLDDVPELGRWLPLHRRYHEKIVAAGQWKHAVQGYLAAVAFFDAMLGRLIEAFDRSPYRDNTVIVLWSDHGWHLGQKQHWSKFALWEQATRAPFLIVAPGVTKPGQRCSAPVSLLDIYPTLTELCGLPRPKEIEGASLVPLLKNPAAPRAEPAVMTWGPNCHAVRDARWRYIRYADGTEELYDHQNDAYEWTNLANRPEHNETKQRLAQWLPKINKPLTTRTQWLPPSLVTRAPAPGGGDAPSSKIPGPNHGSIIVDDNQAQFTGEWIISSKERALVGKSYRHDGNKGRGEKTAVFTPEIPQAGRYEVRVLFTPTPNRSTKTVVTIHSADGEKVIYLNQREAPRPLGVFRFDKGKGERVTISNAGADGYVVVDAVEFKPAITVKETSSGALQPSPPREPVQLAKNAKASDVDGKTFDLVVIGGTPGGIACAVRAAREGLSVLLVNRHDHLGGIMSSGLGVWDTQWEGKRSPIYDEVRQAFFDYYRTTYGENSPQYRDALPGKSGHTNGRYEPRVAEKIFNDLIAREKKIMVLKGFIPVAVEREGTLVKSVTIRAFQGKETHVLRGKIFADCTYEGDLAALAKVPYRVARESRDEFGEPHAGIIFMKPVSKPPNAEAARVGALHDKLNLRKFHGWQIRLPESTGAADDAVQAYNYRTILTTNPANRVLVSRPANYDPYFLKTLGIGSGVKSIPNDKFSWNRPQLVGRQTAYVEADWTERQRIMDEHWEATLGLLYFLQHDPTVPKKVRAAWQEYGLAKDEFTDNGHRPYEIYVREARRIRGRAIYTQHDAMLAPGLGRAPVHADSIAITEWYMDSHSCTLARVPGSMEEGKAMLHQETFPGQIPYRCLLPQGVDNLLVPVCLSATHVAWGTVRLEPVFMQTGESAAFATALALKSRTTPGQLDADTLVRLLCQRRSMVSFFNDVDVSAADPRVPAAQYFGTKGFFADYDARLNEPLSEAVRAVWQQGFDQLKQGALDPAKLAPAVHAAETKTSPRTDQRRGDFLLQLWKGLNDPR